MKKGELIGIIISIVGVLVAIFAISPESWRNNLIEWQDILVMFTREAILILCTVVITIIIYKKFFKSNISHESNIRIVSEKEYIEEFRELFSSGKYAVVKVFGYTGEVVTNDLFEYKDRYHRGTEIRFLHRNWIVEKSDEEAHNLEAKKHDIRPWVKAAAIREMAFRKWDSNPQRRIIRYYSHQPILKGVIFCDEARKPIISFINFQKWVPLPDEGGSVFKSVPSNMFVFEDLKPEHAHFLTRLNSQFEYEWKHSKAKEDLIKDERLGAIKK